MTKYYKKVNTIVENPWTQPVLTSSGTLGGNSFAVQSASNTSGSYYDWQAFDGNVNTWWISESTNANYYVYNPVPLHITNIYINGGSYYYEGRFNKLVVFGSNDNSNYTLIDTIQTTLQSTYNLQIKNNKGYKYYNFNFQNTNNPDPWFYISIKEITLTATQLIGGIAWQECTKEEYDQLPADQRKIITDIYNGFVRKYLNKKKIIETPWTQPVLKSNGVIGADNTDVMAIAQISTGGTTINNPYNAMDSAGFGQQHLNGGLIIDFKKPIYIRSLTFSGGSSNWDMPYKWTLYVSNDNINYTSIGQFSAVPCIINLPQKYRYIKMIVNNASNNGAHYFWSVANLKITGMSSTVTWQECTKEEYDNLPADQRNIVVAFYSTKKISGYRDYSINFTDNNIQTVGTLTIDNNGIASGFSNANYCQLPAHFAPPSNWEVNMCVQPHSTATLSTSVNWWESHAMILGIPNGYYGWVDPVVYTKQPNVTMMCTTNSIQIMLHSSTYDGGSTGIGTIIKTGLTLSSAKFYDIKINFTGTSYIAQYREYGTNNWITLGTISSSTKIGECQLLVGHSYQGITGTGWIGTREDYFNGKIDLFNSYIKVNNQLWWSNKQETKSGSIITNYLAGVNSEMKEVVVERDWTQPVLTSNGTLGGGSFAVYTTSTATDMPQNLYKAFNSTDNPAGVTYARINKNDVIFYSPNPLKCNQFSIMDYWSGSYYQYGLRAGIVKGSNNGTDWVTIDTISGGTAQKKNVFNFTNNNFYKYYKLTPTDIAPEGWYCQSFRITNNPTQQISQWQH